MTCSPFTTQQLTLTYAGARAALEETRHQARATETANKRCFDESVTSLAAL